MAKEKKAPAAGAAARAPRKVPGQPAQAPAVAQPKPMVESEAFARAVNVIKLNRAIGYVQQTKRLNKGAEFEDAVMERYAELGGLLREDNDTAPTRRAPKNNVVNMAENDGSDDDDKDDE